MNNNELIDLERAAKLALSESKASIESSRALCYAIQSLAMSNLAIVEYMSRLSESNAHR